MEPVQATDIYPPLWPSLWPQLWPKIWEPSWRPEAGQPAGTEVKPAREKTALSPVERTVPDASFQATTVQPTGQLYTEQPSLVAAKRQQPVPTAASLSWVGQRIAEAQWQEKESGNDATKQLDVGQ